MIRVAANPFSWTGLFGVLENCLLMGQEENEDNETGKLVFELSPF